MVIKLILMHKPDPLSINQDEPQGKCVVNRNRKQKNVKIHKIWLSK
jgi:hypothetical protein